MRNHNFLDLARRARFVCAAAVLGLVTAPLSATASHDSKEFMGGGFGPTRETAIRSAFDDAAGSASAEQLYTCKMVGEAEIFPGPDPSRHRNFTAQVTVECTP